MHPFVALMRTYCIDYTNSHDQSLYDEIMAPDYVVRSFGAALPRDTHYASGVRRVFDTAPGLGIVVHEFVLNGDRLAMHFSEHAAMPGQAGPALTCWRGIGLYKWNGTVLTENWVEQDYHAMQRQMASGVPDPLIPPHIDPWTWTEVVDPDPGVEEVVRRWVERGDLADADRIDIDDMRAGQDHRPVLDLDRVEVDDLFSAGPSVPFHVTHIGTYRGGLGPGCEAHIGQPARMGISGIARVVDGRVSAVDAVTCRVQAAADLTGRLHVGF